jgi:hypothetical protein
MKQSAFFTKVLCSWSRNPLELRLKLRRLRFLNLTKKEMLDLNVIFKPTVITVHVWPLKSIKIHI